MTKKKTNKWNFAVVKSAFGDYWIGKTVLPANNKFIFATFEAATSDAISRTDSKENTLELEDATESEAEPIRKEMEKWIIKS